MVARRWQGSGLVAALLAASAAWAQAPAERFDFRDGSLADTEAKMRACVGQPQADLKRTVDAARAINTLTSETRRAGSSAVIVTQRGRWACIAHDPSGYPAWPLEALDNIATVEGIDAAAVRTWRLALLEQLRQTGKALGLVKFFNGNAYEIEIEADKAKSLSAKWRGRNLPAGSFDDEAYTLVLQARGTAQVRSTLSGSSDWQSVVPQRALHWPVAQDWPVLPATPETTAERLVGKEWGRAGERLRLEAEGLASSTATPARSGFWEVVAPGLLHIQWSDRSYETLRVTTDGFQLTGIRRRMRAAEGQRPAEEMQVVSVYELVRKPQPPASPVPGSGINNTGIGVLSAFEQDLQTLGLASGPEAAAPDPLAAPARKLFSPGGAQPMLEALREASAADAAVMLPTIRRILDLLRPHVRAVATAFRADPERFGAAYLDLTDLSLRLVFSSALLTHKTAAAGVGPLPVSDLLKTRAQSALKEREDDLARYTPALRPQAQARLERLRQDFPELLAPASAPR